jgi:hypothetical protein
MPTFAPFRSPHALADRSVMLVACVVVAASACTQQVTTCGGLHAGDRVEITVVEPYDSSSQYTYSNSYSSDTCNGGVDFTAGQVLDVTVARLDGDTATCASSVADFGSQSIGGWTWALQANAAARADVLLAGQYTATDGACTGNANIVVSADGTPFAASVAGQSPHAVLVRSLSTDASNSACPTAGTVYMGTTTCTGAFVVSLRKL